MISDQGSVAGMTEQDLDAQVVIGRVKWFDPTKGFGFVLADSGGPDILLHANVLRNFGQSSVADGAEIEVLVQETERGVQAVEVIRVTPQPNDQTDFILDEIANENGTLEVGPLEPARVKWFDKSKGFGFANVFGRSDDVFVHIDMLRRSGLAELQSGEAICLRIAQGRRGLLAAEVQSWEASLNKDTE